MNPSNLNLKMMKLNFHSFIEGLIQHSAGIGWLVILLSLLLFALGMTSCQGDEKESDPRDVIERTWLLTGGTVTKDGSDVTSDYTGLQVTFSDGGTYTTVNGGHFFKSAGTWAWQGSGMTGITCDGDFSIQVIAVNETDLHLQLTLNEDVLTGGRTAGLVGEYDIKLKAQ